MTLVGSSLASHQSPAFRRVLLARGAQIALGALLIVGSLLASWLSGTDIPLEGPYAPLVYAVALFAVIETVAGVRGIVRARRRRAP